MTQREFLNMLHVAERLKDEIRHSTTSKGREESVAEHSWRITLMAFWLRNEFPEADIDKVIRMCLIHDLGECFTGDIPVFAKTDADTKKEDQALRAWVDTLPKEIAEEMNALYDEMDALETTEAKLYKALDKLEALIQHNEAPISTWEDHEYSLQQTYGWPNVEFDPWIRELRQEVLKDTMEKIEEAGKA
ncbi:MAG: HD domain-containing protein [Firmicutes bacterium]|nr:HD domain-containing protein [Bacillota bacterium]